MANNFIFGLIKAYVAAGCIAGSVAQAGVIDDFIASVRKGQSERQIAQIAQPAMLSWDYLSVFRTMARHHVAHNSWNEPLKINEPYNGKGTALYITKPSKSNQLPSGLQNNCTALFGTRVVVCDGRFIEDIGRCLQDPGATAYNDDAVMTLMYMKSGSLLNWIFGHEIGHVALGHTTNPPKDSWTLPRIKDTSVPPALGNSAEIAADEYAYESMFGDLTPENEYLIETYPATLGLLAYHVLDNSSIIPYTSDGHPPIAARLYNSWYVVMRAYDLFSQFTDDDKKIRKISSASWSPSDRAVPFCDESSSPYDYPMVPGAEGAGYELVRSLILGWIYRDAAWSSAVIDEINRTTFTKFDHMQDPTFVKFLSKINDAIFAESNAGTSPGFAQIDDVVANGLPGESIVMSEFARSLAIAVEIGGGHVSSFKPSSTDEKMLKAFDLSRQTIQSMSINGADEAAKLALTTLPILLLLDQQAIGDDNWVEILHTVIQNSGDEGLEITTNYVANAMEVLSKAVATDSTDSAERTRLWNTADTLYVAANYAKNDIYAYQARRLQFSIAAQDVKFPPSDVWSLFYEAAFRVNAKDPNEALIVANRGLKALNGDSEGVSGSLPRLDEKLRQEYTIRFSNLAGWLLVRDANFDKAVAILRPAEELATTSGCPILKRKELCTLGRNPTLVFILDNLAEALLGQGNIDEALQYALRAEGIREEQRQDPNFAGFDANVILNSARIRAACLLRGDATQKEQGLALVAGISDTFVQILGLRRPTVDMFMVNEGGAPVNLLDALSIKPKWLLATQAFDEFVKGR